MIKKWIKKFNEKLHKANEDDRGSAFVMVVIGVMATAIIGATVLSLATNYFVSVVVDQQGTDNYYETEAIVAEIRSGIEEVAGVSNEVAYMETLDSYNAASRMFTQNCIYPVLYMELKTVIILPKIITRPISITHIKKIQRLILR